MLFNIDTEKWNPTILQYSIRGTLCSQIACRPCFVIENCMKPPSVTPRNCAKVMRVPQFGTVCVMDSSVYTLEQHPPKMSRTAVTRLGVRSVFATAAACILRSKSNLTSMILSQRIQELPVIPDWDN